jgi:hypothetical protein
LEILYNNKPRIPIFAIFKAKIRRLEAWLGSRLLASITLMNKYSLKKGNLERSKEPFLKLIATFKLPNIRIN